MYHKAYGIIESLAPLHVGASAGEETGNLNLIFRDQYTQTGMIPGSSIRGRFRADMRQQSGSESTQQWYGSDAGAAETSEAQVKFEHASLVWLPVFCPGQPVVWVSCPRLLRRYQLVAGIDAPLPKPYSGSKNLQGRQGQGNRKILFFNLGFLELEHSVDLSPWLPANSEASAERLVVVGDGDMAMIHDMALYRQSRVKLADDQKKVDGGAFFNVEALPEGSILVFPIALRQTGWQPFGADLSGDMYFGGLESVGFGRCRVTLGGDF